MSEKSTLPVEAIQSKIYFIRGKKVMLDRDLAELYGVETKYLKRQVYRNRDRFPEDFMFQLLQSEFKNLRSQIVTSSWGGIRYMPLAFTEQGIAMLSGILNSKRAININIHIMRTFVKLRELTAIHKDIFKNLNRLTIKQVSTDKRIDKIDSIIEEMLKLPVILKRKGKPIGFKQG